MLMKSSNNNIRNRNRDLPACSAVPQPTAPPPFVSSMMIIYLFLSQNGLTATTLAVFT